MWLPVVDSLLLTLAATANCVKLDVTVDIQRHYRSGCVVIFSPDVEETKETMKALSAEHVQVSAQQFNSSQQLRQSECQRNKALHVLLSSDHLTKFPLTEAEGLWLVFLTAEQDLNEFLEDVHIPVDSEFLVARVSCPESLLLNEVYRMAPGHPLHSTRFGSWHSDQGLTVPLHSLVKRRSNFHGNNITATSMNYPPLVVMGDDNKVTGGLFGIVWHILEKRLNFQTVYVAPEQKTWGALLANNTTTGMIAMLNSGKADVAMFNMLMTSSRLLVMDFTVPLMNPKYHIFIRKPEHLSLELETYLAPFSRRLWVALVLLILLISVLLPALYCLGCRHGVSDTNVMSFRIKDSLFLVFGAFCQQGMEQNSSPQLNCCRVVYLTTYLTAVILLASYSATLVSFLAVRTVSLPFNDLEDVLCAGTHKLGTLSTSTILYHFSNAPPHSLYHRVYADLLHERHNSLVADIRSGLLRVCDEPFLLMAIYTEVLVHLPHVHCRVTTLPVSYFQSSLSIGLRLNSPYKAFFNYQLQRLVDDGVLPKLRRRFSAPFLLQRKEHLDSVSVQIEHLLPVLNAVCAGIVLGVALLCLEMFIMKKRRHHLAAQHIVNCSCSPAIN